MRTAGAKERSAGCVVATAGPTWLHWQLRSSGINSSHLSIKTLRVSHIRAGDGHHPARGYGQS